VSEAVEFEDLSPRQAADPDEDRWLAELAQRLDDNDHVVRLTGSVRDDDEDEPALSRGPDGRWWAGRFIGEIRFQGRELSISPRLGIDVVGAWLAYALNLRAVPKAATQAKGGPLIARLVDQMWTSALADAARHGPPRFRETRTENGAYVRGRLDVAATLRHRVTGRPLVASTTRPRTLDNPVARVLVLADRTLSPLIGPDRPWRPALADETLDQLRGTVGGAPVLPAAHQLRRVRYAPITRGFEPVARLAHEIARRRGTLTSASSDDTSGMLVDVADLWELFLLHCARRAFGAARVDHGTALSATSHLLEAVGDPTRRIGRLKPDLLLLDRARRPAAVVDAKYKRLRSTRERPTGVARGDLYQLAAYMAGHDVGHGALAYPPHSADESEAEYGPWQLSDGQIVEFLRMPAEEAECVEAMRERFGSAVGDSAALPLVSVGR
jgi:5-methylcytosine-specific restriction enzyme subunit McrC